MKKLFLILLPFLFIACQDPNDRIYDFKFVNDSSVDVTFKVFDKTYTVQPTETCVVQKSNSDSYSLVDHPRVNVKNYPQAHKLVFENMTSKTINVYNTTSLTITLSEKNGLLGDNYGDTLSINGNSSATATVYGSWQEYIATTEIEGNTVTVPIENLLFY